MKGEENFGFILRSNYRKEVFLSIKGPIMPSQIEKNSKLRLTHITRELRYLKERGLIECINPNERIGRLYRLTTKGKNLKNLLINQKLI